METTSSKIPEQVFAQALATRPVLDHLFAIWSRTGRVANAWANKWSVLILTVVCTEPARFNAIKRRLEGITHKALTEALRRLERNGLISRRVITSSPIAVEYSITALGLTLQKPFSALFDWAVQHQQEVEQAQRAFDEFKALATEDVSVANAD